jgi:molybdopterin converting factor small subunit
MNDEPAQEAEIRLAGSLANRAGGRATTRVRAGQTILQAVTEMGLPPHQRFIATVNGRVCPADYVIAPGDHVALFPPIAGGKSNW